MRGYFFSSAAFDALVMTSLNCSRSLCVGQTLNCSTARSFIMPVFKRYFVHSSASSLQLFAVQLSRKAARNIWSVVRRCCPSMTWRRGTCVVGVSFWSRTIAPRKWIGASCRPSRCSVNFRLMSSQRDSHCVIWFQTYCRWKRGTSSRALFWKMSSIAAALAFIRCSDFYCGFPGHATTGGESCNLRSGVTL